MSVRKEASGCRVLPVAEGFQGVQGAVQVLLQDQRGAGPPVPDLAAAGGQFRVVRNQEDVLAGDAFTRFEDAGVRDAMPVRVVVRRQFGGPYGVQPGGGQGAPQLGLVLRAIRGPPVLAGQPEVAGGQGGLGLEVVAVGEDRGGRSNSAGSRGDSRDHGTEVQYVARYDVQLAGQRAATAPLARVPPVRLPVGVRLIGQQRHGQAEAGRGRQEAFRDGVGGVAGQDDQARAGVVRGCGLVHTPKIRLGIPNFVNSRHTGAATPFPPLPCAFRIASTTIRPEDLIRPQVFLKRAIKIAENRLSGPNPLLSGASVLIAPAGSGAPAGALPPTRRRRPPR
ncbi:hypothetical protein SRIMM317S_04572 [Streptomyces rimosus subsp. rimosus]